MVESQRPMYVCILLLLGLKKTKIKSLEPMTLPSYPFLWEKEGRLKYNKKLKTKYK